MYLSRKLNPMEDKRDFFRNSDLNLKQTDSREELPCPRSGLAMSMRTQSAKGKRTPLCSKPIAASDLSEM